MACTHFGKSSEHYRHSGNVSSTSCIRQICHANTAARSYYTVNPQAVTQPGTLDVFCANRRSVMLVKRPSGSLVAIVAIGAMLVGSVKYNPGIEVGSDIRRGQCLGAFLYGGSTVVSLYQKGKLKLDPDLVEHSSSAKCETYVKVSTLR